MSEEGHNRAGGAGSDSAAQAHDEAERQRRAVAFYARFDFMAVPRREIVKGDMYANHGTITKVIHGPRKHADSFENVAADEVLVRCGKSFACKGKAGDPLVIGRRRRG